MPTADAQASGTPGGLADTQVPGTPADAQAPGTPAGPRRPERSAYASIRLADRNRAKLRASSRDTCIWETPSSALICDCVRLL
jgi:hypothetical protein